MCHPNDRSDGLVNQSRSGLGFEEDRVMLEQRWVKMLEDGGKVDSLIFNAYMVTVNGHRPCRKPQQTSQYPVSRKVIARVRR